MITSEMLLAAAARAQAEVSDAAMAEALEQGRDITVGLSELINELNVQNVGAGVGNESLAFAHVAFSVIERRSGVPVGLTVASLEDFSEGDRHLIDTVSLEALVDSWEWTNRQLANGNLKLV